MKERRSLIIIAMCSSVVTLLVELLINYRIFFQISGLSGPQILLNNFIKPVVDIFIHLGSIAGVKFSLLFLKMYTLGLLFYYASHEMLRLEERKATWKIYVVALFLTIGYIALSFISPFYFVVSRGSSYMLPIYQYLALTVVLYLSAIVVYVKIGKSLFSGSKGMLSDIQSDPFGKLDRVFHQNLSKIENDYSVNISYRFTDIDLKEKNGWINFINIFRANTVLGIPGSGKTFAFFLPAIQQLIEKGFSMVIYDFKFSDLTEYAYHCLVTSSEKVLKLNRTLPQFAIISLENTLYSERCNVFQPQQFRDFTVDAYGLAKAFMVALNPSWKNKEGDFFPESATNLVSATAWALKIYKNGRYCSLPHLIEFLSQDTESIVKMLINLKDTSLRNVIRPFEEAFRDGAMEQLQGQMGTVRIALSRLTSKKLYFMLTEDPNLPGFDLQVNSKTNPKILCLANSGQNQGVNNIILSLFVVQIFRFINKKGQSPCAIFLDEAVTLSYPKGTLDTLIATGRSNLVSVWLGFQDLAQMVRDMGKDTADAIFKMIGNTVAGTVRGATARSMMEMIGKMKILKRSTSVSAEGDISESYQEQFDYAVPESFISNLSQGNFCGTLSDNIDQKMNVKAFYGEVNFQHPFKDKEMPSLPYSKYWTEVIARDCKGMGKAEIDKHVEKLLDENFERVIRDIENMKEELLNVPE
jgi:type IV secretory pathway TraG/TraD family ATPase VirD4